MHRFKAFLDCFKAILKHEFAGLTCVDSKHFKSFQSILSHFKGHFRNELLN